MRIRERGRGMESRLWIGGKADIRNGSCARMKGNTDRNHSQIHGKKNRWDRIQVLSIFYGSVWIGSL
jgi:hypothetical protein